MSARDERTGLLRSKIEDATALLKVAESELERAVTDLRPVLIGDKRMSTVALEGAFAKLRTARQVLSDLNGLLATELAADRPGQA
jgi:hypothetical protein